eukprot:5217792-Pyramimonas_sp.AAC.1
MATSSKRRHKSPSATVPRTGTCATGSSERTALAEVGPARERATSRSPQDSPDTRRCSTSRRGG